MNTETKTISVDGHVIEITHPDKVLFPKDGVTKFDLAAYYEKAAEKILPYLKGHPISMKRYVDGIGKGGFYQKEIPDYFPEWVGRVSIPLKEEGGKQQEVVVENSATLVYLAEQDCITPHSWLSKKNSLDYPEKLVFDLDPGNRGKFENVCDAARRLKKILEGRGLVPFVMTTGSSGLHVVVPLSRKDNFDRVREFAKCVADEIAREEPSLFTTETRIKSRKGRIFIDYLRNAYAATAVTPYCVRARNSAPVATPLSWDELTEKGLSSQKYNIYNIFARLGHQKTDPWHSFERSRKNLPK